MLIYKDIDALSNFRRQKLLKQLKKIDPKISDVQAEYIHFVDCPKLSKGQDTSLASLLTYGSKFNGTRGRNPILVVPRTGTISPWSSKATDIVRNCGLRNIKRVERGVAYYIKSSSRANSPAIASVLHDRMTEQILNSAAAAEILFASAKPKKLLSIDILIGGQAALEKANKKLGWALTGDEIEYLYKAYRSLKRNPTDAELMMFAQVNSEHCRHKIFNADWLIDGQKQPKSLFKMIRNTYEQNNGGILSAYSDNSAVLAGATGKRFFADQQTGKYSYSKEPIHSVIKVETHNHPTAIAPDPGAATGAGGEIRDEGATGRGAKPKMGLAGYSVSNLNIPGARQPWEKNYGKPDRITSALDIMLEAPIGAASFVNEYGRPNLAGYFRTYEQNSNGDVYGYHKPIMIAGGLGNIRDAHVAKRKLLPGDLLIVLGGPSMLIGLGGGAASSMQSGSSHEDLDFASVQRANAEIERRAQEVIDACWSLGANNPIISIHDVGAGGLSNALPELVHDSGLGATFELRNVPSAETGLSPLQIWCNEAQERYVLGISEKDLAQFKQICERERCPFAVVGTTTKKPTLVVNDALFNNKPVNLPMSTLFGKPPKMTRLVERRTTNNNELKLENININEAIRRVLHLPSVGSKKFLITIGDRSVGGMVARDQMIGPWQVPVGDVAVTAASFKDSFGEAMTLGERTPLAVINAPASARMAIGEAITNMVAADVKDIRSIKLSANWMAAVGFKSEDEKLYDTVRAVGEEFCPAVGLTIPVGKDSLSMRTTWQEGLQEKSVTSPLSLIISAFSPVQKVEKTLTPQLTLNEKTELIFIDLSGGQNRLGGSALAQVYNQVGSQSPDADAQIIKKFFKIMNSLKSTGKVLAYHDRSDGGLFTTLCEMAFAARCGLDINLSTLNGTYLEKLFNEELGVVIQIRKKDKDSVIKLLEKQLGQNIHAIGKPTKKQTITIANGRKKIYKNSRSQLEIWWSETSYQIQKLRDNPACADQEHRVIEDNKNPGISPLINFDVTDRRYSKKPKVAIFREQGVNGHIEMAAAFDRAGFASIDVHLNDIVAGRVSLDNFAGLVACGGFSYGDVLGAGEGWAKTILFDANLRTKFSDFFQREDSFTLGVCNGCQMLAALKELIPGAQSWPDFLKNKSEQFESRLVLTKVNKSPSIFFTGMEGSCVPIPVAHGEGRAQFFDTKQVRLALENELVPLQYIDNYHEATENYPFNPNGSPLGITALTTQDGRATIMMPHPERAFMVRQLSWRPASWSGDSPWMQMFYNARNWVN